MDNPDEFRAAISQAQMSGAQDFVEVSERLFKFLCADKESKSLTYGNPGIRVFVKGTRDKIIKDESENAEPRSDRLTKEARLAKGMLP